MSLTKKYLEDTPCVSLLFAWHACLLVFAITSWQNFCHYLKGLSNIYHSSSEMINVVKRALDGPMDQLHMTLYLRRRDCLRDIADIISSAQQQQKNLFICINIISFTYMIYVTLLVGYVHSTKKLVQVVSNLFYFFLSGTRVSLFKENKPFHP